MTLHLSPQLELPDEAALQRFAILAMSGAGKSNTAAVMAEEMYDAGIPWVAIDPKGDWWGMRSSRSGKGDGLKVPVLGGLQGDVPLEPTAGKLIAETIAAERLTCILDVSEFDSKADQLRFLTDFAQTLLKKNRDPLMVFAEEADEYLPQRVFKNEAQCVGAWTKLVKRGRFRGVFVTLITQRSAALNNDALTQIDTLIPMRNTAPPDRAAIEKWVVHHAVARELLDSLPSLEDGEAWIWSPQKLKMQERAKFRRRRTFDSGETPQLGTERVSAKLANVDLSALQTRMAETIEEAKANDPTELRNQIKKLKLEVARLEAREPEAAPPPEPVEPEIVEVAVFPEPLKSAIHKMLTGASMSVLDHAQQFAKDIEQRLDNLDADFELAIEIQEAPPIPVHTPPPIKPKTPPPIQPRTPDRLDQEPQIKADLDSDLTPAKQRVLDALAWLKAVGFPTPTKVQAGFIAEYRVGKNVGGTYGKILGELRAAGLIDYPDRGRVCLTAEGDAKANVAPIERTTAGLQQTIMGRLSEAEGRVLQVLINVYPEALGKQEAGAQAGYTVGPNVGGTYGKILGTLRMLGLADYPSRGMVAATSILFID